MRFRGSVLLLVAFVVMVGGTAWASGDIGCAPQWALEEREYRSCSNLPFLSPANDTRVNLKLLLVDAGQAVLQARPVSEEDALYGYGKVPFSPQTFEKTIFKSTTDSGAGKPGDESAVQGEGSRCVSNGPGKADFLQAVERNKKLSAHERSILTDARNKLAPDCVDAPPPAKGAPDKSRTADGSEVFRQFSLYIDAARAFYSGRYGEAESGFKGLVKSDDSWLRETSEYMLGRTALNLAQQKAFDQNGFVDLAKADKSALRAAEGGFGDYLRKYPDGRYAASAGGLLRRVYWLSDQTDKLAAAYGRQLSHPKSPERNVSLDDLITEIDLKLFSSVKPDQIKDPLLLAVMDLSLLRGSSSTAEAGITFQDIEKQRPLFAGRTALFQYLLAAHCFYVQKDPRATLTHLSDSVTHEMTYLDFSRLVLRGLALEAAKDYAGARKLWTGLLSLPAMPPLQSETLQLALAINYEHNRMTEEVFKASSAVREPKIREILLRTTASPALLREVVLSKTSSARERDVALHTLLYKDLLQGRYRDYIGDHRLLPTGSGRSKPAAYGESDFQPKLGIFSWSGKRSDDSYNCPSTIDTAAKLARNPVDRDGLICLGDFVKANYLETADQPSEQTPGLVVLGSGPTQFPGKFFSRGEAYKTVIADPKVTRDQKAYSLFRLIKCYEPSGNNDCGGKTIEQSQRKSLFRTLKTRYADTVWSKNLEYYW